MAGAYSTDLRSRVLAAVEAGESPDAASTCAGSTVSIASPWTLDGGALRGERLVPAPLRDA